MILRAPPHAVKLQLPALLLVAFILVASTDASVGDNLPEFKKCVEVCKETNCATGQASIPLLRRLLFWSCPAECDYACQHIITEKRVEAGDPVVQFHGKWPFYRFLGMQEPFSVLFSLLNFLAHQDGLAKVRAKIPASYSMRKYYISFSYFGLASWIFSMIFHTRDFTVTEQLDYFAAGASVLYGLYFAVVRIFRLDREDGTTRSMRRFWTVVCVLMYAGHVTYLKWFSWDYTYNMAANVVVGIIQNIMWTWFSIDKYRKSKRIWAAWPGVVVAWLIVAMSLELLDFPPILGCLDAHSLWHLGTVAPTVLWYNFLLKDAQDDMAGERLKA